jgi:hypothetical protein
MSRQFVSTVAAVAALVSVAAIGSSMGWSAIATPADQPGMSKADFDRTFAAVAAVEGPAFATGVAREELRRYGRNLLRADAEQR